MLHKTKFSTCVLIYSPSQLEVNYTATNKTYQTGKDTSRSNEIHHAQVIISSDSDDEELEFLKC